MNSSNFSVLQIVKNERSYLLHIPIALPNPFDEALEVVNEFAASIVEFKKQALARAEEQKLKEEMVDAKAEADSTAG